MEKASASLLLASYIFVSVSAIDSDYAQCNCDEEGLWSIHNILESQRVSDFFIAIAYFSIPVELLYFVSRSNLPFKWVFLQFIAFIVLCGLTHLLNAYTYYGPHSFQLVLSLTIAKLLTALVSCATAITLFTLIPLLLKIKVRELFLKQNVLELDQEIGMIRRQKEASWHVRMLTREIRKSLDKHTILYTTLVKLSNSLALHNCAVWMPNEDGREMYLTHELKTSSPEIFHYSIPINDPDVLEIIKSKGVRILRPESVLGSASKGGSGESGAVAAIRMPMLHVSNFKGGTPEFVDTSYAILVLVLPNSNSRPWSHQEMEIVEVVADQVAVALSHANILEESQLMRQKLAEQNRALQQAKKNAMMASQARKSFQKVMSHGMRRPMHSILGLLSMFQEGNLRSEQKIIVDTMIKVGHVLSSLINDVMEISVNDKGSFQLEMKPFNLHLMMRETACIAKCLCVYKGFDFKIEVQKSLPDLVIGDQARAFQVILHMIDHLLNIYDGERTFSVQVYLGNDNGDKDNNSLGIWRSGMQNDCVYMKFDFQITGTSSRSGESASARRYAGGRHYSNEPNEGLSFSMCKTLAQMMQGNIWLSLNALGLAQSMTLALKFQIGPSHGRSILAPKDSLDSRFRSLKVVLADDDDINRTVTKKLLEKLGCQVTAVSSGFECLGAVSASGNTFNVILLDLHMPEMDGFDVAMRIRKFHSRNWPLIIALTASAEEDVMDRCLRVGMNGLIRKPILLQEIADELRRALQHAGEKL
ncbi:protein EIN4-like [Prosopis cineraria]|uniref:protein EIN4-like n=1 Tax=Prosopis cineraria TaxID=364024 RepID=UPI00240F04DA|nr:protein EIN4-like [Prosopis cineraria]XP_054802642.1 protein EIN4-like [Prosopis cineraria]XP_054802643.1 protein EIN4-like [Prosopis cineraria]